MNNRQTVEIAALISAFSPHIVEGRVPLPTGMLEKFWDRSQRRTKLWLMALTRYQRQYASVAPDEHLQMWRDLEPILEEIFVSEVLTRVWCAALTARDQAQATHSHEPIARNVLLGHLDARRRALQLLVTDTTLGIEHLTNIDRIRRRVERWTDLMLGHLVETYQVDDFAFDSVRAREFGAQQLLQSSERPRDQVWVLLLVGLRMAFPESEIAPPHELLQEEIVSSILACFPPAAFQAAGPFKPILERRIPTPVEPNPPQDIPTPVTSTSNPNLISFLELRHRQPPRHG
ncbi:MAG: hypothetical protein JWN70_3538 [Planctomycetaceae bacterium]|nr:hypothetical protein [Planctomycetaceae bacterium]